jgi:hypothetical protein
MILKRLYLRDETEGDLMPNRIIKESICISENLNNLTADEECFFLRLTVKVDDFGRYDARPAVLRASCYPLKLEKVKEKDIEKWLKSLVRENLIVIYHYRGKPYLYLTTWKEHQTPRAKNSKFPDPTGVEINLQEDVCNCMQMQADVHENGNENDNHIRERERERAKHGKHVSLTPDEYTKLVDAYGEQTTEDYIERLGDYIDQIGVKKAASKYKSHYATIKSWYRRDNDKKKPLNKAAPMSKSEQLLELVNSYGGVT